MVYLFFKNSLNIFLLVFYKHSVSYKGIALIRGSFAQKCQNPLDMVPLMSALECDDGKETGGQISLHFCGLDGDCLVASDSMA